ncbi:MAG TPA: Crp/Fnr family transcriptional regulator, partial [Cytophagales bacterium]|nr:Crp/Fnr family transcriptional regulator [Cytophagales bacterium]
MESLAAYIQQKISLNETDRVLLSKLFVSVELPAKSIFIAEGKTEHYLYFLADGIVRGYKNQNGKLVVEHLVEPPNFVTALDSFFSESVSTDCFETLTECVLYRISREGLGALKAADEKWSQLIEAETNESLRCKMQRVNDFQTLTAKERYLKFIRQTPQLALQVSVENIASYLGIEPQSLSRIRRQ